MIDIDCIEKLFSENSGFPLVTKGLLDKVHGNNKRIFKIPKGARTKEEENTVGVLAIFSKIELELA